MCFGLLKTFTKGINIERYSGIILIKFFTFGKKYCKWRREKKSNQILLFYNRFKVVMKINILGQKQSNVKLYCKLYKFIIDFINTLYKGIIYPTSEINIDTCTIAYTFTRCAQLTTLLIIIQRILGKPQSLHSGDYNMYDSTRIIILT